MKFRGIFTRVFRMFAFLNLLFFVGAFLTGVMPRIKTTKRFQNPTPSFYVYGVETKENITLYTSDGSSGSWKRSNEFDGEYYWAGSGKSLEIELVDENLEGWYKCGDSEPVYLMKVDSDKTN